MFIAASVLEAELNRLMNQMSGKATPGFTPKQGQYLAFIDAYTRVNRRPPAERDIQRYFGVTPPTVHQMILTLERAGFIRRTPGASRSIQVLVAPEDLPILQHPDQPVKTSVSRY
jgi:DNA-binding MarR family transcriptional regulator